MQAVDHLSVILAALAARPLGGQTLTDGHGTARVRVPGRDWEYYLDLGLGQVRRYGHTEPRVVIALLRVAATSRTSATLAGATQAGAPQAGATQADATPEVREAGATAVAKP